MLAYFVLNLFIFEFLILLYHVKLVYNFMYMHEYN